MKKYVFIFCMTFLSLSLFSFEIHNSSIYPGVVNHINTSYGYGSFRLNIMESDFSTISISRILTSNNSLTLYEYSYNSNGQLTAYKEKFKRNDGDFINSGDYTYEYLDGKLDSVKEKGREIYHPTQYFLNIKSQREELLFDYEFNKEGEIISFLLNDENGTKYFLKDGLLKSVESIGLSNSRLSLLYDYSQNRDLVRYRLEYSEGRGLSKQNTKYDFIYNDRGIIEKYFFEKSGQGQPFSRVNCTFDHILNDDDSLNTSFAINEDAGDTVRTAKFEYENRNNYSVKIYDEEDQLIVTYIVEQS